MFRIFHFAFLRPVFEEALTAQWGRKFGHFAFPFSHLIVIKIHTYEHISHMGKG